jgi:carbamoyl-phosphate synthase large subunit
VEADAISDGNEAFIPAIMEHIELAGIHSGDSACVLPPVSIPAKHLATITEYTKKIAIELKVKGLINIQYAIANDQVYILEANPRASRTVPIVSKVCGLNMVRCATQIMLGKSLRDLDLKARQVPHFGVKESVFPFNMFHEVDPVLGPEMRSTGEVLGLAANAGAAFFKAQEAAQATLPTSGTVLITVAGPDKKNIVDVAREFVRLGFRLLATGGTHEFLAAQEIASERVLKLHEGSPNVADRIKNGDVHLLINTPAGKMSQTDDSYLRKAAIKCKVPYITTPAAAKAAVKGIAAVLQNAATVKSLQEYHREIA